MSRLSSGSKQLTMSRTRSSGGLGGAAHGHDLQGHARLPRTAGLHGWQGLPAYGARRSVTQLLRRTQPRVGQARVVQGDEGVQDLWRRAARGGPHVSTRARSWLAAAAEKRRQQSGQKRPACGVPPSPPSSPRRPALAACRATLTARTTRKNARAPGLVSTSAASRTWRGGQEGEGGQSARGGAPAGERAGWAGLGWLASHDGGGGSRGARTRCRGGVGRLPAAAQRPPSGRSNSAKASHTAHRLSGLSFPFSASSPSPCLATRRTPPSGEPRPAPARAPGSPVRCLPWSGRHRLHCQTSHCGPATDA
jgi:hypothetical protein